LNPQELIASQRIEDTGALTKKRMETIDKECLNASLTFIDKAHSQGKPFFVWFNTTRMHIWTHLAPDIWTRAVVAGGVYTLVQYLSNRQTDRQNLTMQVNNAKFDAKKPFYSAQLDLCQQAASAAAILATPKLQDAAEAKKAEGDFWRLYWGTMGIVEDPSVEGAMVALGHCLQGDCAKQSIQNLALSLAHSCRDLISQSWNLELQPLNKKKDD
jgi:hypothetical protein